MEQENENGKLLIDSVQLRFGDNTVLQGAYVTSYKGRVTGVLGRNGICTISTFSPEWFSAISGLC